MTHREFEEKYLGYDTRATPRPSTSLPAEVVPCPDGIVGCEVLHVAAPAEVGEAVALLQQYYRELDAGQFTRAFGLDELADAIRTLITARLEDRVKCLTEALREYANEENWRDSVGGDIQDRFAHKRGYTLAQAALQEKTDER